MLNNLLKELKDSSHPDKAKVYKWFFKTGKGQYGEGDKFIGLTVPEQRKLAQKYINLSFNDIQTLLNSEIHEHRLTGLLILTYKYKNGEKEQIYDLYSKNFSRINNWDLVDVSAPNIVGNYLLDKDKNILKKYANSNHLWTKRIAIVSTLEFIKNNQFNDTIKISEILLDDKHDLIHKACGWMLREVGKKDVKVLEKFLDKYSRTMPRTMLRYSIEKFSKEKRTHYMAK
ncbi:DNA alkylation repair protein [Candidatus Woesearchaeota archaeon]|jgi:3-methyladenine DNA glycosylase AlkD|nr:DNA alkylation repair protein [Candidatus Woesearchaeota archaeon]